MKLMKIIIALALSATRSAALPIPKAFALSIARTAAAAAAGEPKKAFAEIFAPAAMTAFPVKQDDAPQRRLDDVCPQWCTLSTQLWGEKCGLDDCSACVQCNPWTLIKSGAVCDSDYAELGLFDTIDGCADKCAQTDDCRFFTYGTGSKAGKCYHDKTSDGTCSEGWVSDSFSFYVLTRPIGYKRATEKYILNTVATVVIVDAWDDMIPNVESQTRNASWHIQWLLRQKNSSNDRIGVGPSGRPRVVIPSSEKSMLSFAREGWKGWRKMSTTEDILESIGNKFRLASHKFQALLPKTYSLDDIVYPCILKVGSGYGGQGITIHRSRSSLNSSLIKLGHVDWMIQEAILGPRECSLLMLVVRGRLKFQSGYCFDNRFKLYVRPRSGHVHRNRLDNGSAITGLLGPYITGYNGILGVDYKFRLNGQPVVLEFNTRLTGAIRMIPDVKELFDMYVRYSVL